MATASGQAVLYVTERCVFELTRSGLELIEVAPGIDAERDVLAHMPFRPLMRNVKRMDTAILRPEPMHLEAKLFDLDIADRVAYDTERDTLFLNFEGLQLRTRADLDALREVVVARCEAIGHRVPVVVNYDAFWLDPELEADFGQTVRGMEEKYYTQVSRFTTSAFMRTKLAQVLTRNVRPHLFESKSEAQAFHEARH